jgi:hypothetical protein
MLNQLSKIARITIWQAFKFYFLFVKQFSFKSFTLKTLRVDLTSQEKWLFIIILVSFCLLFS